jgi:hypothetical protein
LRIPLRPLREKVSRHERKVSRHERQVSRHERKVHATSAKKKCRASRCDRWVFRSGRCEKLVHAKVAGKT